MFVEVYRGTKAISEDLRKRVVDAYQAGKGYETISKEFGVHQSTGRQLCNNGGNSRPLLPSPEVCQPTKKHRKT